MPKRSRTVSFLLGALPVLLGASWADPDPKPPAAGESLPANAVARVGTTRLRHGQQIDSVAFSPDGKKVNSSDGYSVGVWDARTGRELAFRMLRGQHQCWPRLSPDGTLIACRVKNGLLGVQEVETDKVVAKFPDSKEGRIHNLTFSKDNRRLASTDAGGWCRSGT
jgi:WD40 repeat protein